MGIMRRRLEEELRLRGYSPRTVKAYVRGVKKLVEFYGRPATEITGEEIRTYLLHMLETQHLSGSSVNQTVCAIRFFYVKVLGRPWEVERVVYHKRRRKLPIVLSRSEIASLLAGCSSLKQQALLTTLYSTGLRLREATQLVPSDIDSQSMRILVREAKGGRQRYVMLSPTLLRILRAYFKQYRPTRWLFYGHSKEVPIHDRTVQRLVDQAANKAELGKRVTPHTLRHTFATHLLEQGTNVRYIQELLGHRHFKTTMIYTHVRPQALSEVQSPLDYLGVAGTPIE